MNYEVQVLAEKYGWGVEQTGGGCDALEKTSITHNAYITDEANVPTDAKAGCTLGIYLNDQENSEPLISFDCPDLETAMRMFDMILE